MARIGVFGGSFDPPHNGHLALCLFARELLGLDRVIISVSNNPFKHACDADDDQRFAMAALLVEEANAAGRQFDLYDWELRQAGPSYTVNLMAHLHEALPDAELVLLVGEDSYRQFDSWHQPDRLFSLCRAVVFRRGSAGEAEVSVAEGRFRFIDFDYPLSSTDIRARLDAGLPVEGMLPSSIASYIARNKLYGAS